jgi:hypothetical protein
MTVKQQVESFISEYQSKLSELNTRLQDAVERAELLQLEIRMLNEKEIPDAQAKAILGGGDEGHVNKLKKQFAKYSDELQAKQEAQIILQNAIKKYQYQAGEKLVELDRLNRQEKSIQETKHYAKMMYYKQQFINAMIEEGKAIKELNSLDTMVQEILVQAGRKNGVYVDSNVKSTASNTGDGRIYLGLSIQEVQRFVRGNYSSSDYDYLKKYSSLKDLR